MSFKINFDYAENKSEFGSTHFTIHLDLATVDEAMFGRIVNGIKDALKEPEEIEEKRQVMGFHVAGEDTVDEAGEVEDLATPS